MRAFRHRSYVALWLGALVSNIGTWMETVAVGVYVTETTGRAAATGAVAAVMYLPAVVLSPIGGALADRFDRRRYLAVMTSAQAVVASALAVLAFLHRLTVPSVALLAFLTGCLNTLLNPAFTALLAELVPAEDLHSALSLNSAQFNLGRIIGPALAAAVLATGGAQWAFGVNALSFFAVLAALTQVRTEVLERLGQRTSLWGGVREGLRYTWADPGLRLALSLTFFVSALISPFIGLVPVFAIRVFHQGAATASLFTTCQGVGAVTCALGVGTLNDYLGRRRLLVGGSLLLGPVAALYWLSPTPALAAASIFVLGGVYLVVVTGTNTYCQSRVPRTMQARVSSLFSTLLGGGYALGLVALGLLSDHVGVRIATVGAALLFLALVAWVRVGSPERMRVFEDRR
nr:MULTISPECIES: MFS transporter [Myxococcaceae]